MVKNSGEHVLFDPDHLNANASQLHDLLNMIGQHFRIDGKAGITFQIHTIPLRKIFTRITGKHYKEIIGNFNLLRVN